MNMHRIMLMLVLSCLWCSHAIASDDLNNFISNGNSEGHSSYWNWKPTTDGGWEYIAAWMNQDGEVVWEGKFATDGSEKITTPKPHVPFHDRSGQHGFSVGSGNWSHPSCFMFQICDGGGGSWDPQ